MAEQFRESARLWGRLAAALLPNPVALFKETKQLATRRRTLFEKKGMAATGELQAIGVRLADIKSQVEQEFPLNPGEVLELLAGLRDRVLAIHQVEAKAVSELQALLGQR